MFDMQEGKTVFVATRPFVYQGHQVPLGSEFPYKELGIGWEAVLKLLRCRFISPTPTTSGSSDEHSVSASHPARVKAPAKKGGASRGSNKSKHYSRRSAVRS